MAKDLKVHFSSASDDWATPQPVFDALNAEFGPFELDVCATADNKKCGIWFGPGQIAGREDGLAEDWADLSPFPMRKYACWMNPPYGRTIGKWVQKAYEESQKGCLVVSLLPARTDTRWFHNFIHGQKNVEIRFLKGRLKFGNAKNSAPFPSMVVIFRPVERSGSSGAEAEKTEKV